MKTRIVILFLFVCIGYKSQFIYPTAELKPDKEYENIYSRPIAGDSLVSSFIIWIKKSVAEHRHLEHSEHIFIVEGEADMLINGEIKKVEAGDFIFIPKNTWHSVQVRSEIPLKVISIQAPHFDGKDRHFKN